MKHRFHDPLVLPGTALGPAECLARAQPLEATDGQAYVERRGVPIDIATGAGVRFDPDWAGRPAVLIALRDCDGEIRSAHGRYLHNVRGQDKMLTIGPGGGAISVLGGWRSDPLIVVEAVAGGVRPRRDRRLSGRRHHQQRPARSRRQHQGHALRPGVLPASSADRLAAEHDRLHRRHFLRCGNRQDQCDDR